MKLAVDNKPELIKNTKTQKSLILENTNLDYVLKIIKEYGEILGNTTLNKVTYIF
jgi:hypothetical protein